MPELELTDDDRAAIDAISKRRGRYPASVGGIREEVYLAGLAAGYRRGVEDAIACCENSAWKPTWSDYGKLTVSESIAKTIRAMLAK